MTKVEVFHCAACNIYLSTSSSVVHSHLTSQEHLSNTKVIQRLLLEVVSLAPSTLYLNLQTFISAMHGEIQSC